MFRVEAVLNELVDIVQFLQEGKYLEGLSKKRKEILAIKVAPYTLINGSLYKLGQNGVLPHEGHPIIDKAHGRVVGGHFYVETIIKKILRA